MAFTETFLHLLFEILDEQDSFKTALFSSLIFFTTIFHYQSGCRISVLKTAIKINRKIKSTQLQHQNLGNT